MLINRSGLFLEIHALSFFRFCTLVQEYEQEPTCTLASLSCFKPVRESLRMELAC
jgi:hypothetical protein